MMTENISAPKQEKFRSYRTIRNISTTIAYVLLTILAFIWVVPILWIFISAFVSGLHQIYLLVFQVHSYQIQSLNLVLLTLSYYGLMVIHQLQQ